MAAAANVTDSAPRRNTARPVRRLPSGVSGQYPAATQTPIRRNHHGRRRRTVRAVDITSACWRSGSQRGARAAMRAPRRWPAPQLAASVPIVQANRHAQAGHVLRSVIGVLRSGRQTASFEGEPHRLVLRPAPRRHGRRGGRASRRLDRTGAMVGADHINLTSKYRIVAWLRPTVAASAIDAACRPLQADEASCFSPSK